MATLGEVSVVAPDAERSAVGHAITTITPLRVKEVTLEDGLVGYAVNGTPADSVKLAVGAILKERPDLVVSGINLGPNTATNIIYSGTVSAATEARILGIPRSRSRSAPSRTRSGRPPPAMRSGWPSRSSPEACRPRSCST